MASLPGGGGSAEPSGGHAAQADAARADAARADAARAGEPRERSEAPTGDPESQILEAAGDLSKEEWDAMWEKAVALKKQKKNNNNNNMSRAVLRRVRFNLNFLRETGNEEKE